MADMKKRAKAAILGGLVADAASMPLHVGWKLAMRAAWTRTHTATLRRNHAPLCTVMSASQTNMVSNMSYTHGNMHPYS